MITDRLSKQIEFIIEIDKLKNIIRNSYIVNTERKENSAEHSWHLTVIAMILAEYANKPINLLRVFKMLLVHDVVEIDAGDTFCYDTIGAIDKAERERRAADRIFGLLPEDQANELNKLWIEFETRLTPESQFAAAIDRLMPLLHNYYTNGKAWQEHSITSDQVFAHNAHIREGSSELWNYIESLLNDAIENGYLTP